MTATRTSAFAEHARRYSELGWALVRLDGKVPKGKQWQETVEPLEIPPAVLAHFAETRRNGSVGALPEQVAAGEGRNRMLASLAGTLRRRVDGEVELASMLEVANQARCRPPLDEQEVAAIARSIFGYNEPKNSFPPPIDAKSGGNANELAGELAFAPLAPLLEQVPPEPPWLVRGYLAPFAITLLAGRPKVGKSTLVCALLADVAGGEPFVGLETSRGGVLLLTEERRDTLAEKARILGLIRFRQAPSPIDGGNESALVHALMRHDAAGTVWPEIVRQAMAYCAQHELATLVVDTFDRWTGLRGDAENAAGAVNEALEPLQYAAAAGLAVLLVSHQRKSIGEFGEAVRGSTALTGGVDVVVELERPSRALQLGGQARVLRAVSRFSSTPEELYLELDEHGFVPIESPEQVRADSERERVLTALEAIGEPSPAEALAEDLELPTSTVRRHLRTLLERGVVARNGAGKKNDPYLWSVAT